MSGPEEKVRGEFTDALDRRGLKRTKLGTNPASTLATIDSNIIQTANRVNAVELHKLGKSVLSQSEEQQLLTALTAQGNRGLREASYILLNGVSIRMDDGTMFPIRLISPEPSLNEFTYATEVHVKADYSGKNRLDLILMVNGIPLAHIEFKAPGVDIGDAIGQLKRYHSGGVYDNRQFRFVGVLGVSNGLENLLLARGNSTRKDGAVYSVGSAHKATHKIGMSDHAAIESSGVFSSEWFNPKMLMTLYRYGLSYRNVGSLVSSRLAMPHQLKGRLAVREALVAHRQQSGEGSSFRGHLKQGTGTGKTQVQVDVAKDEAARGRLVIMNSDRVNLRDQMELALLADSGTTGRIIKVDNAYQIYDKLTSNNPSGIMPVVINSLANAAIRALDEHKRGNYEPLRKMRENSRNITTLDDESHRTVDGEMFATIVNVLEHAVIIGFTATDIKHEDQGKRQTSEIFGKQLASFNQSDSVLLGVTLPVRISGVPVGKAGGGAAGTKNPPDRLNQNADYALNRLREVTGQGTVKPGCGGQGDATSGSTPPVRKPSFTGMIAASSQADAFNYHRHLDATAAKDGWYTAVVLSFNVNGTVEKVDNGQVVEARTQDEMIRVMRSHDAKFGTSFASNESGDDGEENSDNYSVVNAWRNYEEDAERRFLEGTIDFLIVVDKHLTGSDFPPLTYLFLDKNFGGTEKEQLDRANQAVGRTVRNWIIPHSRVAKKRGYVDIPDDRPGVREKIVESLSFYSEGNPSVAFSVSLTLEEHIEEICLANEDYANAMAKITRSLPKGVELADLPVTEENRALVRNVITAYRALRDAMRSASLSPSVTSESWARFPVTREHLDDVGEILEVLRLRFKQPRGDGGGGDDLDLTVEGYTVGSAHSAFDFDRNYILGELLRVGDAGVVDPDEARRIYDALMSRVDEDEDTRKQRAAFEIVGDLVLRGELSTVDDIENRLADEVEVLFRGLALELYDLVTVDGSMSRRAGVSDEAALELATKWVLECQRTGQGIDPSARVLLRESFNMREVRAQEARVSEVTDRFWRLR